MNWQDLKEQIYFEDGSFRDIYAFNLTYDDWRKWCDFVNQNYEVEFIDKQTDEKQSSINFSEVDAFWQKKSESVKLATIKLGEINVNCHFFVVDEFENDITPNEIKSLEDHKILIDYLKNLSKLFNRQIYLTCENSPDLVLIETSNSAVQINDE